MAMRLDAELLNVLRFLQKNPSVRRRLAAPPDKTVVYSGGMLDGMHLTRGGPADQSPVHNAWKLLAQAKAQDPVRFNYITLEERLKQFHVVEFGESLFEHANRVSASLSKRGLGDQALILWRALSGIYVQGAIGKVRALILPGAKIGNSVFNLTEVNVLLKEDVLRKIEIDPERLREFRILVKSGMTPGPLVVM